MALFASVKRKLYVAEFDDGHQQFVTFPSHWDEFRIEQTVEDDPDFSMLLHLSPGFVDSEGKVHCGSSIS